MDKIELLEKARKILNNAKNRAQKINKKRGGVRKIGVNATAIKEVPKKKVKDEAAKIEKRMASVGGGVRRGSGDKAGFYPRAVGKSKFTPKWRRHSTNPGAKTIKTSSNKKASVPTKGRRVAIKVSSR